MDGRSVRRATRVAVRIVVVLAVLLCAGVAIGGEVSRLRVEDLRFAPGWVALAFLGFFVLQLMHAELWHWQLRSLGGRLGDADARAIWCVSALARYVPTSVLMPTLRVAMASSRGVPKRLTFASLIYEAALALVGALIVSAYFIVDLPRLAPHETRWAVLAAPLVALALLHPRVFGPLSAAALRRARRPPLPVTLGETRLLTLAFLYAVSFLLAGASLYALARGLHDLSIDALPQVLGAFAIGVSASVLAFVLPAGLGARELALVAALDPVMPAVVALAVAIASRIVQISIELVLAAATPAIAAHRRRTVAAPPGAGPPGAATE